MVLAARASQRVQDAAGPVRVEIRGDQARAAFGGQGAQQPSLPAGTRAQVEPQLVLAGYAGPGQGQCGELAGLILDGSLAAGHQRRWVAARQPEAVRRPAGPLAVRQRTVRAGAEGEDYLRADVSRGEDIVDLGGVLAERIAEGVDDPARVAVPDG